VNEGATVSRSRITLDYHDHRIDLAIVDGRELVLSLDGIARKRRRRDDGDCVYVWTNVELHWEEHHYIEGRWWPASGRVLLTSNGATLVDTTSVM